MQDDPASAEQILQGRLDTLRANMTATLTAMAGSAVRSGQGRRA